MERAKKETIDMFMGLIKKNIEDSCVFIRQVILSLYKFPDEQTKQLKTLFKFYNEYKVPVEKMIIEYLKVPKLCDESKKKKKPHIITTSLIYILLMHN